MIENGRPTIYLILCLLFTGQASGQVSVTVDPSKEYQTVDGFGAFGGIKPYWESPPFYTEDFLGYFLDDLGSSIVRTNIFWDLEATNDNSSPSDLDLSKFNFKAGSNLARQIPYYKALKAAGLQKLIATSWTPPAWMKLHDESDRTPEQCYNCNNCPAGDERRRVCGGRLDPRYYAEYAEYLMAYVLILKQEADIDLYAISIQNEPWFANPFESNVVRPEEFGTLLNIVGRKFRDAGLRTKIFGPEHMAEWSWGVQKNYVQNIFKGGVDNSYLDTYAVHGYVDGVAPDFGSAEGWTALKQNISNAYDKPLWMTETSGYPQTLNGAMDLAKSMYLALRFGGISAWVYWSISGEAGSEFALMADGEPTILYYTSKQFFKYIRPGARRLECSSSDTGVLPLAFQNPFDGSMTLVMINNTESQKQVNLDIAVRPELFTVYRTSATENSAMSGTITGSLDLPAKSVTTLVGYGPSGPSIDEIPNYYLKLSDDQNITVPLSGLTAGSGTTLDIQAVSSDEDVVALGDLTFAFPGDGTLILAPNTSEPGKAVITLTLTNNVDEDGFGFNQTQRSFVVEIADVVTGLKKKVETELSVYPNPARRGIVSVDLSGVEAPRVVVVRDGAGKKVFKAFGREIVAGKLDIDTSLWSGGVYVIEVSSGKRSTTRKLVIH